MSFSGIDNLITLYMQFLHFSLRVSLSLLYNICLYILNQSFLLRIFYFALLINIYFIPGTIPGILALFLVSWHYSWHPGTIPGILALFLASWHYSWHPGILATGLYFASYFFATNNIA